eukprot:gene16014-21702_t
MSEHTKPVKPFGQRGFAHKIIIDRGHSVSHVTLPAWGLKALSGAACLVLVWAVAATAYLAYREIKPGASSEQHRDVASAYEDHIDKLRAQVEELKTRSIVERSTFEDKVKAILRRQASLESKAGLLQSLDAMVGAIGLRDSQSPSDAVNEAVETKSPS